MRCYVRLATLIFLVATSAAWAQDREGRQSPSNEPGRRQPPSREIEIPSGAVIDEMLAQDAVPNPAKEFSPDDGVVDRQLDRRAKKIDREIMKGICNGC